MLNNYHQHSESDFLLLRKIEIVKRINITPTKDSPSIFLDSEKLVFRVVGSSYPENAYAFYSEFMRWIEYLDIGEVKKLVCEFYFDYLNSSSKKVVFQALKKLEVLDSERNIISVLWKFDDFDEDMQELGEEFAEDLALVFEFSPQKID